MKTTGIFKNISSTATGVLLAATTTAAAFAAENFSTLGDIGRENVVAMSPAEMDEVQGKAIVNWGWYGNYFVMQDDQFTYPFAFDSNNPAVQNVFAWLQSGAIPADVNYLFNFLAQADPNGLTRASPLGRSTSMGPCIPGFTVGC